MVEAPAQAGFPTAHQGGGLCRRCQVAHVLVGLLLQARGGRLQLRRRLLGLLLGRPQLLPGRLLHTPHVEDNTRRRHPR